MCYCQPLEEDIDMLCMSHCQLHCEEDIAVFFYKYASGAKSRAMKICMSDSSNKDLKKNKKKKDFHDNSSVISEVQNRIIRILEI